MLVPSLRTAATCITPLSILRPPEESGTALYFYIICLSETFLLNEKHISAEEVKSLHLLEMILLRYLATPPLPGFLKMQ